MLSVLTPPATTALTTVPALRRELKLATEEHDTALADLIAGATDAIQKRLGRICARRFVRETLEGTDDVVIQLASPPIVHVTKVTFRGEVVTDYEVTDPHAGHLYRERGWETRFSGGGGIFGDVRPSSQAPRDWGFEYGCGWLLPGDEYSAATITAEASDKSFTDAAAGFPLLAPGDVLEVVGGANAGRKTIVTRTPTTLTFVEPVVTEAAGTDITLAVRTLPRDIERACIVTASAWWMAEGRDPEIASKRVADTTIAYREGSELSQGGSLPPRALGLLTPWGLE